MIFTENMKVYQNFFNDIDAGRYFYVDFKCKGDKWTNRNKPKWFNIYQEKSNSEKEILITTIKDNVYNKLPNKYKDIDEIKVKRFHSFLRICYDMMFNGNWNTKIIGMSNMFNKKYEINEIIRGDSIFCATGITSGDLMGGITKETDKYFTETIFTHDKSILELVKKEVSIT